MPKGKKNAISSKNKTTLNNKVGSKKNSGKSNDKTPWSVLKQISKDKMVVNGEKVETRSTRRSLLSELNQTKSPNQAKLKVVVNQGEISDHDPSRSPTPQGEKNKMYRDSSVDSTDPVQKDHSQRAKKKKTESKQSTDNEGYVVQVKAQDEEDDFSDDGSWSSDSDSESERGSSTDRMSGCTNKSNKATPMPSPKKLNSKVKDRSKGVKISEGFMFADLDEYILRNADLRRRRSRSMYSDGSDCVLQLKND